MQKMKLTDKSVEALPLAPKGERYEVADLIDENMRVRVGARRKTLIFVGRFGQSANSTRRKIGEYPPMKISEARTIVASWEEMVGNRIDPRVEAERANEEETLRRRHTCRSVLKDYIVAIPSREFNRGVAAEAAMIRRLILTSVENSCWVDKPICEVTGEDIAGAIETIRLRPAPTDAYNMFSIMRTFFNWASSPARKRRFGLVDNPIRGLRHKDLMLRMNKGKRVLNSREARAYLKAAQSTPYPYGPFATAVMLTGQRLNEVAGMRWSELRLGDKLWEIPEARFKTGMRQIVPLSDPMIALLAEIEAPLPEKHGDCVFSTTNGRIPINGFGKAKKALHTKMLTAMQEEDPFASLPAWSWHDVRRTLRTQIEAFATKTEIAEAAIGHMKRGLQRVYNHYDFRRELRSAFNSYAALLDKARSGTLAMDEWGSNVE